MPIAPSHGPHLLVDISAHGYGHLSQAGPVLDALAVRLPGLRLTVRSALPREQLARRIAAPFTHLAAASDFGFAMRNSVDIDYAETANRYREFHAAWPERVAAAAATLSAGGYDAVLSNVAYLPLAAAQAAGIPAFALCSLNWADLFADAFGTADWAGPIHNQMLAAYRAAELFLRVSPGMPMAGLPKRREIGAIARIGAAQRGLLAERLELPATARCVLVAMGGIAHRLDVETWPRRDGLVWLVPAAWGVARADVRAVEAAGMHFADVLASVDAVITKPGYGTFVEAACSGVPVLYFARGDWVEEEALADWLHRHGRAACVARDALEAGRVLEILDRLWAAAPPPRPQAGGIDQAAAILGQRLAGRRPHRHCYSV